MKQSELLHIVIAIVVLFIVIGFKEIIDLDAIGIGLAIIFSFVIIVLNTSSKKLMGRLVDADVEHSIWYWSRYSMKQHHHLKRPVPFGVILPLFVTAFSLGAGKLMTLLSYDTTALKRRAAKRHGYYSFTEMTEWHNALVGAAGIMAILLLSLVSYFIPILEPLARLSAFYAFWNIIPFSKLDGSQIYFGSRILWWTLAIITLVFATYALILP